MATAMVILLVITSAAAGYTLGAFYQHTSTETTTVTAVTTTISVSSITTYRPLDILLGLSGNSSIPMGTNETFTVSLTNELSSSNNATYTGPPVLQHGPTLSGTSWNNYVLPVPPSCGSTPNDYIPYYVVIYNQSGAPLELNDVPPSILDCISSTSGNYHVFSPSQVVTESVSVGGFWRSSNTNEPWVNATYIGFGSGTYTVVAFDAWGQQTTMYFEVQ
jgi:hypothetical protein